MFTWTISKVPVFCRFLQDQRAQSQRQTVCHHTEQHQDLLNKWEDGLQGTRSDFADPATTEPTLPKQSSGRCVPHFQITSEAI